MKAKQTKNYTHHFFWANYTHDFNHYQKEAIEIDDQLADGIRKGNRHSE
jgi:hypothetical protein